MYDTLVFNDYLVKGDDEAELIPRPGLNYVPGDSPRSRRDDSVGKPAKRLHEATPPRQRGGCLRPAGPTLR